MVKKLYAHATIPVHICTGTLATCIYTQVCMGWCGSFFLFISCKMSTFFHFAQFFINWCNCSNNLVGRNFGFHFWYPIFFFFLRILSILTHKGRWEKVLKKIIVVYIQKDLISKLILEVEQNPNWAKFKL